MCTVTFIPNKKGFILTSNRDESLDRGPSSIPVLQEIGDNKVLFPKDPLAGGTWIATSDKGRTVCLLNGAFEAHKVGARKYRKSRGLVLLDGFGFEDVQAYANDYDLQDIEPFTLVIVEQFPKLELYELRWDGKRRYFTQKDPEAPHIYSSATLYPKDIIENREKWFAQWLDKYPDPQSGNILDFHQKAGEGNSQFDLIMKREEYNLKTVSTTQIKALSDLSNMRHINYITGEDLLSPIKIQKR